MNILIPHKWLLEHLDTEVKPEKIQELLSLSGPSVERIYDRDGDQVYDIEVTTNRVDGMSVRGIAREAAVILEQAGKTATLKPLKLPAVPDVDGEKLPLPIIKNDADYCKRVTCVVLADVKRSPTPKWMADRLVQIDQQVHDAVIDITNYITHELGHPCHAFDYDKIMELGGEIIVTVADAGKIFVTLDGEEYTTVGGEVVFENLQGEIIDLPAIKGTANTSINDQTKNVLLWIESLDAQKVRFASMTHAIRTVAAQLNEKNVDPHLADGVMQMGVSLFRDLCDARVASQLHDEFPGDQPQAPVEVKLTTIDAYLGLELEQKNIVSILEKLGCQVGVKGNDRQAVLTVQPPTFRSDLRIPADIVEEIARIYGYHNLPSVLMDTAIPLEKQAGVNFALENQIKHFLSDIGWQEVYSYSMVSEALAEQSEHALTAHLKLQNPLTDDRVYLRRSLLPSLEEVLTENPHRQDFSVFEIANVYQPHQQTPPNEILHLSLVSRGEYRVVKGSLEALLEHFFVKDYVFEVENKPTKEFHQSAKVMLNGKQAGVIGVLKSGHVAVDLEVAALLESFQTHPEYQPIPKTTALTEDMTFTLPEKTLVGEVMQTIKQTSTMIQSVTLKDTYKQNLSFQIAYLDPNQNVSSEDVEPVRKKIVEKLQKSYQAKLVGAV